MAMKYYEVVRVVMTDGQESKETYVFTSTNEANNWVKMHEADKVLNVSYYKKY